MSREYPLPLISVLQHLDAVLTRDWRANEISVTRLKSRSVCIPPLLSSRRIWPWQSVVLVHINVRIVRIIIRTGLEVLRRLSFEIEEWKVDAGNQAESLG